MKKGYRVLIKYNEQKFEHSDRQANSPRMAINDAMRLTFQHQGKSSRYYDNQIKVGEYIIISIECI